jgi:sulfur-oxidizing protein SoxA
VNHFLRVTLSIGTLSISSLAAVITAWAADWPNDPRLSGNHFLTPSLRQLQNDAASSPISLWLDNGASLWADSSRGASCQSCHGKVDTLKSAVASFPKLVPTDASKAPKLINLEDQIMACRERSGTLVKQQPEDPDILALSALLHNAAIGQAITPQPPASATLQTLWNTHLAHGTQLYATRLGRMNLACVHCHDQSIGKQMRADVISPGNPTGFPIYRMSWQTLGSIDRRLRACYSGVQAVVPPAGDTVLRELELYLKVRATGLPLDGPAVRR